MTKTREELELNVVTCRNLFTQAQKELSDFINSIDNNVFESLDAATAELYDRLMTEAQLDCEGDYNCGDEEYIQDFIVDGKAYRGTLKCEYNRYDKRLYYVDGAYFTVEEIK